MKKNDSCVRASADGGERGGGLSLDDELFSVAGASHVLTFGGKDSFSPDIAEFWSREKRYAVGTIGET